MNQVNLSVFNEFFPALSSSKWLIEILQQPILLLLTFTFGYFLYLKYKNKVKNNEFKLTDNQSKLLVIGTVIIVLTIAHNFLGM